MEPISRFLVKGVYVEVTKQARSKVFTQLWQEGSKIMESYVRISHKTWQIQESYAIVTREVQNKQNFEPIIKFWNHDSLCTIGYDCA